MSGVIDGSSLFNRADGSAVTMRTTTGDDPRVSAIDFTMVVTGQNNDHASQTVRNLKKIYPGIFAVCKMHQFPGARQSKQTVLCLSECVEVMGVLPGNTAKEFRKQSATLLTRLFAGDPTLHDVITKNGLSDGLVNQAARAELRNKGAAVEVADEEETRMVKKIRQASIQQELGAIKKQTVIDIYETKEMVGKAEKAEQQTVITRFETMDIIRKKCEEGASDSQKRWMNESFQNHMLSMFHGVASGVDGTAQKSINNEPVFTDDMQPVSISIHIIIPKGLKDPGSTIAKKVGVIAKRMYVDKYGQYPPQEWAKIEGLDLMVNKYCKRDLPMLEDAFNEYDENTRVVESQRIDREKKEQEKLDKQQKKAAVQAEKEVQRLCKSGLDANQGTIQFKRGD
jgi:hypothetical protein